MHVVYYAVEEIGFNEDTNTAGAAMGRIESFSHE
jgi:hypothetical protein